jgi:hypothetical protein
MLSTRRKPSSGPSNIAAATERFSSTTADGSACNSTSYRSTICRQSVCAGLAAAPWTAAIAACRVNPRRKRCLDQPGAFHNQRAIPERPILVLEQYQLTVRRGAGRALPPVELYRLGDGYYVLDGHHRVAAALAVGQLALDARVTEFAPHPVAARTA